MFKTIRKKVKLAETELYQAQRDYSYAKVFGQKIFWGSGKNLDSKNIFWDEKEFWLEKNFAPKKIFSEHYYKKILLSLFRYIRGYSSVVEHSTADREVHGSTPCAP